MKKEYMALVHCDLKLERRGIEALVKHLPFDIRLEYTDLADSTFVSRLQKHPDLIILCEVEADGHFGLAQKIKLFAPEIPLLVILPQIPPTYYCFLKQVMVDHILEKPFSADQFKEKMIQIFPRF